VTKTRKIRVLIIDDDPEDVMILQRRLGSLSRFAVEAEHSENLEQALAKLAESAFHLIFLDNKLASGITAKDIITDFKKKKIATPIIIFTGTGDQKTAVELMKMDVCDYIVKDSCSNELLEKTMHSTLDRYTLKNRQQQSEKQIRQQKELLANVISNIPYFIFWKDRNSIYLGCNGKFAEIAGVDSPEQITGKSDYELGWDTKQADFFAKFDRKVIETGEPFVDLEEVFVREDSKESVFLTSKVPLKDAYGNVIGLLGIYTDITERKTAEKMMKNLNQELETTIEKLTLSNRELRDFAHIVAHDLKSPLRAIGTLAGMILKDYVETLDENGKNKMRLLAERAERMSKLIDAILKYSEIGHSQWDESLIDLNELVRDVIYNINIPKNIRIDIDDNLPSLECEKAHFMQVFQNLLDNAVKYMDKPQGWIKIGYTDEEDFWKFSVADNGPGIEHRYYDKIFKIFQTLSPRDMFDSTGIGLTVVKKIIGAHNGRIWVESGPGRGSTFYFTLPKQQKGKINAKFKSDITCGR